MFNGAFIVLFNLIAPLIQMNLPVRKNVFDAGPKICTDDHFFMLFLLKNVYKGKIEKVYIQAKPECTYQGNCILLKII